MLFALLGLQNTIALCVWLKRGMSDLKIIADTVIDSFEGHQGLNKNFLQSQILANSIKGSLFHSFTVSSIPMSKPKLVENFVTGGGRSATLEEGTVF